MSKFHKKTRELQKDTPAGRPGDHGYGQFSPGQFNRSLHRYNAAMGCFEEVPAGGMAFGVETNPDGTVPKKTRMKVMIKPFTNEAGEVVAMPPPLPVPAPAQQRVARYEEVVEEGGQVVVHVPDSAAGPDGVIRLLQVTNEDGSVHYISADHADMEDDFTMEDAMQMILTEVDHVGEDDAEEAEPAEIQEDIPTQTQQAAAAAEQAAISAKQQEDAAAADAASDAEELLELSTACYVCGEPVPGDEANMTPLMAGRGWHTGAPLAELLADTVQRELTVSTADGVCAACLNLLDRCDGPDGPLKKTASRHVRNVLAVRVGDLDAVEGGPLKPDELGGRGRDPQWSPPEHDGKRRSQHRGPVPRPEPRRPRVLRPWSPTPEELKLEHLTDLTAPSDTKRSARIAIRKNALVANAVHASNRPRVLVVPDMQTKYFSDPRPQRRPYRRLNMNPAKGRRGRPKLPNPPENEPGNIVTVDGEVPAKPSDVEQPEDSETPAVTTAEAAATAAGGEPAAAVPTEPSGPAVSVADLLVEDTGEVDEPDQSVNITLGTEEEGADDPDGGALEGEDTDADLTSDLLPAEIEEEVAEIEGEGEDGEEADVEWTPTPGCPCIMCTDLTQEQQAILAADEDFCTTFVCQVCSAEVVGRTRYKRHEATCRHRQQNPRARRLPIRHECNTCGATFKSARLRDEHYTFTGHEKRSPCPVCHRFFHPDFLRIHLTSHSGAFFCRICDTHFSSKATLKGHMYIHSGLKPHRCDVCSAAFRTPSSLFMHKRYHHTDDRPYACNFCSKGFAARSTLRIHLRQHTGERPFVCKLCPKSYTRKSSLTQHLRSHTQERRHACMTCGKRFDNKTYLKVHMNRHMGIRAHACDRCGRGFYSRPNLLKHMQVLCFKEDYGRPAEEQEKRTRELRAAAEQQLARAGEEAEAPIDDGEDQDSQLPVHEDEMDEDDDDIQTTEVILAIESIPENGELLVGHMVQ